MKPGRNDPCSCGSGKKYKHCCLAGGSGAAESPQELTWRRLRRVLEDFLASMLNHIDNIYGAEVIEEAWDDFVQGSDAVPLFDPHTLHMQVFMPWFFHAWAPDPDETLVANVSLHGRNPTQVYLDRKGTKLDPLLRRYLAACVATPFSFHEILQVEPGHGFRLRDVFTGQEREVLERSASRGMQAGDLLYGMLVETDGITLLEACPACAIPPAEKVRLVELRREMGARQDMFADELLWEWAPALRVVYLDITERLLNPVMPELQNTDGEALALQQIVFDIDTPEAAFDALHHLAFGETREDLLETAERNENGDLLRVAFDWRKPGNAMHAGWDNTVMGRISIAGRRLTADVNSAQRAAAFRETAERVLGEQARYRATKFESLESSLRQYSAGSESLATSGAEMESLMESPELEAKVREMIEAHYDNWINQKIPALNNRTPLAAVADPDGREQVEALLRQIERDGKKPGFATDASVIARLRERLGLVR